MPAKQKPPRYASDGLVAGYVRRSVVTFPAEWDVEQRRDRVAELTADAARDGERIDVWYDDMGVSGRGEFLARRLDFARATGDAKAGKIRRLYARDLPDNRNSSDSVMMRQMLGMAPSLSQS